MDALIHELEEKRDLEERQVEAAAAFLLDEGAEEEKKARFLRALSAKGETPAEIAGFVEAFLERAVDPHVGLMDLEGPTVDVCGTGGDQLGLFNVSTTAMFVVAAAGAVVVKHGNRGVTSSSGGADVLEALDIPVELDGEGVRRCVEQSGIGFLFAPAYHPAFKSIARVRKQLGGEGVRTIFNLMGPLLNPARPQCQLVGVYEEPLCPVFAEILQRLGRESAWAVSGRTGDGRAVDEVSLMGPTRICKAGVMQDLVDEEMNAQDLGFKLVDVEELEGGDAATNATITEAILQGRETGAKRDMVLLNAGAAIACCGLADDLGEGVELARTLVEQGEANARLLAFRAAARGEG